jgi:hypothetical protein
MLCKNLGPSVTIDGITYSTSNDIKEKTYTYYPKDKKQPHFTVTETDGGDAEFQFFHITVIIDKNDGKANKNFHLYFKGGKYERNNYKPEQFKDYSEGWKKVKGNLEAYKAMGRSFWKEMNQ